MSLIKLLDTNFDFFFLLVSEFIPKILILFFEYGSELINSLLIINIENQSDQFEFR